MSSSSGSPQRSSAPVELRVRPLSGEEYQLWHAERGTALGLPAATGTTEVGVLVYARTGPVANALVRAEPGDRLTAAIRALDVLEDGLAGAVLEAVVENFLRGGYTHFTLHVSGNGAVEPFTAVGFTEVGRDLVLRLGPQRRSRGRSRFGRRHVEGTVAERAGETDAASMIAWLGSTRTIRALPRTPDSHTRRALRDADHEHLVALRRDGSTVADAWLTVVEVPGADGSLVRAAVLNAIRLRGGLSPAALEAAVEALRAWCASHGLSRLDAHLPVTADQRLLDHALRLGFTLLGTELERFEADPEQDTSA